MLSKQRNSLLIHKPGDLRLYLANISPHFRSFVKGAKHIHHTELGPWYVSITLNKIL